MNNAFRIERDLLGELPIPAEALHGIHTARALENFSLAGKSVHPELARAFGDVKLACARTNRTLGAWADDRLKADAIDRACRELANGDLGGFIIVDALQGGAGTSTNMNVNEVLANRALEIISEIRNVECGDTSPLSSTRHVASNQSADLSAHSKPHVGCYDYISPLDDLNLHQSTNDTYPTALRLAAIRLLQALEKNVVALQESFQAVEKKFAHVVKVGRTQFQDAVLTTLGREMSAYAEAINRDRWRIYKCEERLRVVNLGGTAIGTGLAAPRQYIFQVVDQLREITGIGFARAENLVDATQNADVFVEVSGILKAHAVSLLKICGDLRLLSSGPEAGFGEIRLPARQAGSSIMPGKVNPVMPEMLTMVAAQVIGADAAITAGGMQGHFELNTFKPLIAYNLLFAMQILSSGCRAFADRCVKDLKANRERCEELIEKSLMMCTALAPKIGYDASAKLAQEAYKTGKTVRELAREKKLLPETELNELLDARKMTEPG